VTQSNLPNSVAPLERAIARPGRARLPGWLRVNLPAGNGQLGFNLTRGTIRDDALHTVCQEARCPNIHDCWSRGTATFMIAGKECTRGCPFCSVQTSKRPTPPDVDEPVRLADAVHRMGLRHVVITVVNRDDLADGGADHYRQCVLAVHRRLPAITIELLCSDLAGDFSALECLLDELPLDVFAHNVECVPRLDAIVRDRRASFEQSLAVLAGSKHLRGDLYTKSSLMIGLGETDAEISDAMRRLRDAGVDMLTLGQYIAPGRPGGRFLPVDRYAPPERFASWANEAYALGFRAVASGPMVRSSYRAGLLLEEAITGKRRSTATDGTAERPSMLAERDEQPAVVVSWESMIDSAASLRQPGVEGKDN